MSTHHIDVTDRQEMQEYVIAAVFHEAVEAGKLTEELARELLRRMDAVEEATIEGGMDLSIDMLTGVITLVPQPEMTDER